MSLRTSHLLGPCFSNCAARRPGAST